MTGGPEWLAPTSLEEALRLRAERADEVTVVAGGTFLGILMNQGFLAPTTLLSLRDIRGLDVIRREEGSMSDDAAVDRESGAILRIGAMTTHRTVERSSIVSEGWPALARTFSLVASPRVRNQATVGGVLADADYASDPPAMLAALGATAVLRSLEGEREVPVDELIVGYYETSMRPDELLVEVRVPSGVEGAVYRKFRSRSSEDRPCVAVAAAWAGGDDHPDGRRSRLRVVVGAVTERPQYFPEICALAQGGPPAGSPKGYPEAAAEIGRRYADALDPISDSRGSAEYRKRVIAVEVRRALEELAASHD